MSAGLANQENDPVTEDDGDDDYDDDGDHDDDDDDDDDDDYDDEAMINNGTCLPQLMVWHIRYILQCRGVITPPPHTHRVTGVKIIMTRTLTSITMTSKLSEIIMTRSMPHTCTIFRSMVLNKIKTIKTEIIKQSYIQYKYSAI